MIILAMCMCSLSAPKLRSLHPESGTLFSIFFGIDFYLLLWGFAMRALQLAFLHLFLHVTWTFGLLGVKKRSELRYCAIYAQCGLWKAYIHRGRRDAMKLIMLFCQISIAHEKKNFSRFVLLAFYTLYTVTLRRIAKCAFVLSSSVCCSPYATECNFYNLLAILHHRVWNLCIDQNGCHCLCAKSDFACFKKKKCIRRACRKI